MPSAIGMGVSLIRSAWLSWSVISLSILRQVAHVALSSRVVSPPGDPLDGAKVVWNSFSIDCYQTQCQYAKVRIRVKISQRSRRTICLSRCKGMFFGPPSFVAPVFLGLGLLSPSLITLWNFSGMSSLVEETVLRNCGVARKLVSRRFGKSSQKDGSARESESRRWFLRNNRILRVRNFSF